MCTPPDSPGHSDQEDTLQQQNTAAVSQNLIYNQAVENLQLDFLQHLNQLQQLAWVLSSADEPKAICLITDRSTCLSIYIANVLMLQNTPVHPMVQLHMPVMKSHEAPF